MRMGIAMMIYDFKVGYSCNNECLHCVVGDMRSRMSEVSKPLDLSTDECFETIISASELGADQIVLTGGEPTIRGDFVDIVKHCRDLGLLVILQTNGRAFADPLFCRKVAALKNVSWAAVAFHGPQEVHDLITRRTGSFHETCLGLQNLIRSGVLVSGKVVISKLNMNVLVSTLETLQSLGVNQAEYAFPHATGYAWENFSTLVPRYSELKPRLEELIKRAKKLRLRLTFETIPFCMIREYPDYVGDMAQVVNGPTRIVKPVHEQTRDWGVLRPSIKEKGTSCRECCYDRICEGPWKEYSDQFGHDELIPVKLETVPLDKLVAGVISR
jgi:MoaA/NifB/PqqE/SkfB family radical SAM enzyme